MEGTTSTDALLQPQTQESGIKQVRDTKPSIPEPENFRYEKLPSGQDHIRLLTILPDREDGRIHCNLETYPLAEAPLYHALSYAWGTRSQSKTIICSDKRLDVTPSLKATLFALRNNPIGAHAPEDGAVTGTAPPLWVDQICINQDDETERAQQVRIMKNIFQRADMVLISLGEKFDGAIGTSVTNLVEQISGVCQSSKAWFKNPDLHFPKDETLDFWGLPRRANDSWPALSTTMRLPYFERIWVVQEVLVAKKAVIHFSKGVLAWDMFLDAHLWLLQNRFWVPDLTVVNPQDSIFLANILQKHREMRDSTGTWRIYDLVSQTTELKSTDPRDKIFALAGIAHDGEEIDISYTQSPMEVFENFARRTIASEESLPILSDAQKGKAEDRGPPSWVPRWDKEPFVPSLLDRGFDAAPGTEPSIGAQHTKGVLDILGLELGVVVVKTHVVETRGLGATATLNLWDNLVEVGSITPGVTPKTVIAKLMRETIWCLVLGTYFDPGETPIGQEADDVLLDEFCADLLNSFCLIIHNSMDEDPEALKRLLHLAQLSLEAHHSRPASIEGTTASVETQDWLRENIRFLDPEFDEDVQKLDELVNHMLTVFKRKPYTFKRFQDKCEWQGAAAYNKRPIFRTEKGSMGAGPPQLQEGDIICVLYGGPTPYALRPTSVPGEYIYLGDCYVHGQMHGEAILLKEGEEKWFRLV